MSREYEMIDPDTSCTHPDGEAHCEHWYRLRLACCYCDANDPLDDNLICPALAARGET